MSDLEVTVDRCRCGHWEVQHRGTGENRRCDVCVCGSAGSVLVVEVDGAGFPQSVTRVGAGPIIGQVGVWLNR